MRNLTCLLVLTICATFLTACKKDSRPEGLPDLYPLSVKILQDGAPLEGASVTLVSGDAALMRWPCGGLTDAQGIAVINTYGFDGAPAGNFKVTVAKMIEEGGAASEEESAQAMIEGTAINSKMVDLVDPTYKFDTKTPLSIDVQATKENPVAEFDVGVAVHQEIKM